MLIKIARLGTPVQEIVLSESSTVEQALTAAVLSLDTNEDIRVNGVDKNLSNVLSDGDVVTLVPKVKGGQMIVKIARLGTPVQEVAVAEDATIQDVINAAGITIENEDVKLDGIDVELDDEIEDGKLVTIVPKVKGGK